MGMVLVARRLSADELQAVVDDPAATGPLIFGDHDEDDDDLPDQELDLDKSWHGIHYLLTGTAWAGVHGAGAALFGGDEIGEDNGYGPARLLRPEAVRAVAAALDPLDIETLRTRFDPAAMTAADIYPNIWHHGSDEFDSYLAPYFAKLRQFYLTAAASDQAVLLALA